METESAAREKLMPREGNQAGGRSMERPASSVAVMKSWSCSVAPLFQS
jgi:hypothetical protein